MFKRKQIYLLADQQGTTTKKNPHEQIDKIRLSKNAIVFLINKKNGKELPVNKYIKKKIMISILHRTMKYFKIFTHIN